MIIWIKNEINSELRGALRQPQKNPSILLKQLSQ